MELPIPNPPAAPPCPSTAHPYTRTGSLFPQILCSQQGSNIPPLLFILLGLVFSFYPKEIEFSRPCSFVSSQFSMICSFVLHSVFSHKLPVNGKTQEGGNVIFKLHFFCHLKWAFTDFNPISPILGCFPQKLLPLQLYLARFISTWQHCQSQSSLLWSSLNYRTQKLEGLGLQQADDPQSSRVTHQGGRGQAWNGERSPDKYC